MNSLTPSVIAKLKRSFPDVVDLDISMAKLSRWRIGGKLAAVVSPRSQEEVVKVRRWISDHNLPEIIIGNTTNLLFSDEYISAIAIKLSSSFNHVTVDGDRITAEAGVYVPCLSRKAMQHGLTGLE